MRILISGAGPSGLTLAYWLEKYGHEAVIVEKFETIRTEGCMIDFTGTGWDVADRMGLIPTIRERAYSAEAIIYKDADDRVISQISVHDLFSKLDTKTGFAALNRRDLVLTLYESIREKVEIRLGTMIESIKQDSDRVVVQFCDGSMDNYDLLIGCDGIHSHTRKLVFGAEDQFTYHLGYQFAIFEITPLSQDLVGSYHMYVEPNMQVAVYPTTPDKWLVFVAFAHSDTQVPPVADRIRVLKERIGHLTWHVPKILDKLQDGDYIFWDNFTQIQMPVWYDNRVALIGDAAYCPTLVSGQGASMAMAGAYFLADALRHHDDYEVAFQMMNNGLRPHIEKIQKSARRFASTFIPKNKLRISLINFILRLSHISIFQGFIGKQFTVDSILNSSHSHL